MGLHGVDSPGQLCATRLVDAAKVYPDIRNPILPGLFAAKVDFLVAFLCHGPFTIERDILKRDFF